MSLMSFLFRLARTSADLKSLSSPKKAGTRAKNKLIGRALARAGVWRRLWR